MISNNLLKWRFMLAAALLTLTLACTGPAKEQTPPQEQEQTAEDRLNQEKMRRSLLFAIIADARIETLSEYVVANDMAEMLSSDTGPFLFFTPINEAFEGIDPATRKLWSNQRNGIVKSLINKHLSRVDSLATDLSYYVGRDLQTLGGLQIKVVQVQDQYFLEDVKGKRALITGSPLRMDNGYIYYIDQILHRP